MVVSCLSMARTLGKRHLRLGIELVYDLPIDKFYVSSNRRLLGFLMNKTGIKSSSIYIKNFDTVGGCRNFFN